MIGRNDIVQYREPVATSGFEQPAHPGTFVFIKFKKPLLVVAALCQVPDLIRHEMTVGSWHEVPFLGLNVNSTILDLRLRFQARK